MINVPINVAWSSDWNGYEVGYDDSEVVGLYSFTTREDETYYLYIDVDTNEVLDIWQDDEL